MPGRPGGAGEGLCRAALDTDSAAPQRLFSTGASNGSGASVKRLESRTAPPYRSVMSRQFLPIHPAPAWTATVLCGSGERQFSSVLTVSVVLATA